MMRKVVWTVLACAALGCGSDPVTGGRGFTGASGMGAGASGSGGTGGSGGSAGTAGVGEPIGGGAGLAGLGGMGGAGGDPNECSGVSETADNMVQPVDIILGIDTSGSMGEEIAFVQQNLNAFSQQIIDSGIDVRVIMLAAEGTADMADECVVFFPGTPCVQIGGGNNFGVCIDAPLGSGTCPQDSNPPIYQHVPAEVGSNDVLNVFINAYSQYSPYLRPGSLKHFVSITDDDATDGPYNSADAFIAAVGTLDPDPTMWATWSYSSIYCFTACAAAAAIGTVHQDLVAKTMGVGGDLCLQDFGPVFDKLATEVAATVQLACEWEIPPPPEGETFDQDKTNVELTLDGATELLPRLPAGNDCADLAAWRYDDEASPTKVLACPAACARIQSATDAAVEIVFGCDSVPIVLE